MKHAGPHEWSPRIYPGLLGKDDNSNSKQEYWGSESHARRLYDFRVRGNKAKADPPSWAALLGPSIASLQHLCAIEA